MKNQSTIKYTIDDYGLIQSQYQEWSISAIQALKETFTPSLLSAPFSELQRGHNEPEDVGELFGLINDRRPNEYTQDQRLQITSLVDKIVNAHYDWKKEELDGTWALAYLQPGPEGGGIDRRIPFPDLPLNNSYQIFSKSSVVNVGEIIGPLLEVRVGGSLQEEDKRSHSTPKRYRVIIDKGGLCIGEGYTNCIPLPISGEGTFDGVYLGERLRIGQNINGGGARVVQVKLAGEVNKDLR